MKNIVIITRRYFPTMSPISAVVDKYIQELKKYYSFHIIAIAGSSDLRKPEDPYINVYYIKNNNLIRRIRSEENYKINHSKFNFLLLQLFRARSAFINLFADGLAYKWEERAYYDTLFEISQSVPIDCIVSVSGDTMYTHKAAQKFKYENKFVNWIPFFTDPYTYQNLMFYPSFFSKKRNKKIRFETESKILSDADHVILVEELLKDALEKFHVPSNKIECFKYVLEDIRNIITPPCNLSKKEGINIIYAGAFYKKIRNPESMLKIMSCIKGVSVDMYVTGYECNDILNKYKSNSIRVHEGVNVTRYKQMICYEYDILLNVGNACNNQVPSKMLEYISTGRPILNFYQRKDSQYEMIEKYPIGINIFCEDPNAIYQVQEFCEKMAGKQLPFKELEDLFPDNILSKQVKTFEKILFPFC